MNITKHIATGLLLLILFTGFVKKTPKSIKKALVTFYAHKYIGRKTASGELYAENKLTCATTNKKYFGHKIKFWHNNKSIVVSCNDMMAPDSNLRFDLTTRAFKTLNNNSLRCGVMKLKYSVLQ